MLFPTLQEATKKYNPTKTHPHPSPHKITKTIKNLVNMQSELVEIKLV